ncbi:hypothetical protein P3X46_029581 [Hevea brasiliensis]|uniref:RING-type E3 ubiquitin transferase BRCA1 n=1 Tax=Hevea brasiliensis TaxID=3981 RepID=A0ABQ9KSR7_HEVBR|nr:uncharacterized protein LOC110671565 [Hevea brasiliensis]XP_057993664.1 uncharacterized protein LOC110671565 [Hevea brasiliensis]KAJ9147416.1 hypothetical protein P3X46_029581 [Hevea brasiliensis]
METVVATVSGYHGLDRFNLIKLISQSGASFVGSISRATTHLVCWKFEGRKYDLAKKFKTIIVNHQWVVDCIKQAKRVLEQPYMLQSGKEVGPLLLEVPITDKVGFLNKNREALADKSNISEDSERLINGMGCGDSGPWTSSLLLDENLFPEVNKKKTSASKSKPNQVNKSSKQERRSSGRYCFQDPPLSGLVTLEHEGPVRDKGKILGHEEPSSCSDKQSMRGKRKTSDNIGSTSFAESSRIGRRLVKKNVSIDKMENVPLDFDQECFPIRLHNENSKTAALSENEDCERNVNSFKAGRTSDDALNEGRASTFESFDDIEEIRDWNHVPASKDSLSYPEEAQTVLERPDDCPSFENFDGSNKDVSQSESITRLPTSLELSCVICWTEFSSTRGVLPCGHRFCYSCIQNWADHLISSGKISRCPLCKGSFVSITKVEDAATSDQKIYCQTIPCASSTTDIFLLNDQERCRFGAESSLASVCGECCYREPEDLLVSCHFCQIQYIHIYCLDPPLLPWNCSHSKDLQRLYYQAR